MNILYITTAVALLISLIVDRKRSKKAIMIGAKKLGKILPPFITVLIWISISLYLIPQELISSVLGDGNHAFSAFVASLLGSATVIPGPIAYPLCKILLDSGVAYSVVAAFATSLMVVGIATFPIEKALYGFKFALLRNVVSYFIVIIVTIGFVIFKGVFA